MLDPDGAWRRLVGSCEIEGLPESSHEERSVSVDTAAAAGEGWRERVRGVAAYPGLAAGSGVEQLEMFLTGRAPAPPIARLTGRRIIEASPGSAAYGLPATRWMLGPRGSFHPGVLAMLADGALVASVVSGLPPRTLCTTAELSITFLGRLCPARGEVVAQGRLVYLDAEMGLAEAFVYDADNRLVAHGTSRCAVFPPIGESVELLPPVPPGGEPEPRSPDPWRRPVPTMPDAGKILNAGGLELLQAELRGERPPPPIDQLIGMRLVAAEEGRTVFELASHPWLSNEWGTVYGGVITLLAKSAAAAAVQSTAGPDTGFAALDVKVNFLRAVPVDGRELVAVGTVLHRGKRLAVATSEVRHGDEMVAIATGTTALTPRQQRG